MSAINAPQAWRSTDSELVIRRKDIEFRNESETEVRIELTVENRGTERSAELQAKILAAPFGAFLPWRPVEEVWVPPIAPGGRSTVRSRAHMGEAPLLGPPEDVQPRRTLQALALADDSGRGWRGRLWTRRLPPDLLHLLGCGSTHWAGNLNVFLTETPVERHRARALRVYPGRRNAALFMVGSGEDSYSFQFHGEGIAWEPELYDMTRARSLHDVQPDHAVPTGAWVTMRCGIGLLLLSVYPPLHCRQGTLNVLVQQQSTGRTALVEFDMDESAAGPGCYAV